MELKIDSKDLHVLTMVRNHANLAAIVELMQTMLRTYPVRGLSAETLPQAFNVLSKHYRDELLIGFDVSDPGASARLSALDEQMSQMLTQPKRQG